MKMLLVWGLIVGLWGGPLVLGEDLEVEVKGALRRAGRFYAEKVATHGGYVYYYSPDLSVRWGEGKATADQVWVQVPGTPAVGGAFLTAFEATGDAFFLEAAEAAAEALLYGQLESGGWTNAVDFDPKGSQVSLYRNGKGDKKGKNFSTLDDGITPGVLRFLIRLEEVSPRLAGLKEGIEVGIRALLAAQFSNGAFPQGWSGPVESRAVVKAKYPDYDWRTENRIKNYWEHYTLNDGVCGQVARLLEDVALLRGDKRCKDALVKLGEFLLLAQMPEPQPGWAQQYDQEMRPIWARKFEPPAIAGRESEDAMLTLIRIAALTSDARFVAPIPTGRAWLERSLLPNGKLARYYELNTNRPLYMTEAYELTHDDSQLPKHYGWQNDSRLREIDEAMAALRPVGVNKAVKPTEAEVRAILGALDRDGKWVSRYDGEMMVGQPKFKEGEAYVSSAVFVSNVEWLCRFLRSGS